MCWELGIQKGQVENLAFIILLERETRFELATSTLARLHSTTELFPLEKLYLITKKGLAVNIFLLFSDRCGLFFSVSALFMAGWKSFATVQDKLPLVLYQAWRK